MSISSADFVKWVQRGMNRIVDAGMTCDGVDTPQYRSTVKEFQMKTGLTQDGIVGTNTQNKITTISNSTYEYVEWIQSALTCPRIGIEIPVTGARDTKTKNAIMSFQAFHDLDDDGWVGPLTETELLKVSGMLPYGHIKTSGPTAPKPAPKPSPSPVPTPAIPVSSRVTQLINHTYYHALYNRDAYAASDRQRILCVCGKLKQGGINDTFILDGNLTRVYFGAKPSAGFKYVQDDAREYLTRCVNAMRPSERDSKVAARMIMKDLIKQIEAGLRCVSSHTAGMYKTSSNAAFEPILKQADDFLQAQKKKSNSIISCFKDSKYL